MESLIDIKYGSSIKQVQLPARFSSAGFEKGKGVFGLRYAGESDIIVLDEITDESQLIEVSASHASPLLIVFHNLLSNYQRKEVRLDHDEFNSFLDNIQCGESLTRNDLTSFSRFCFNISDSSVVFPCFEDGSISRDELYNAFIETVEKPLSKRLRIYYSLIDINESGFISDIGVQLLFQILYCQELCCFSTGKLISCNNAYFVDQAHIMSEQFIVDNQSSSNRFSFSSILGWLMNRGNSFFSESFYINPSAEVLDLSPITPITVEKKQFSTELVYYLSYLYNNLVQCHEPTESIASVISHCIDDNNEIMMDDLVDCLNVFFDLNEDSMQVVDLYHFCDLIEKAFSEDEEHLDCSELFIVFGLLSFLHTSNVDECTTWLVDLLCDNEEKKAVSSVILYKFVHCMAVLLNTVTVEQIDQDEVSPTLMVMEDLNSLVSSLYKQILDFTSPNNIQQQSLRDEAVGTSTPNCLFEVIIQYTFITFCQHWNAERILNYLSVLFHTQFIDTLLMTSPQTHLSHFDLSIPLPLPFDGDEFMERISPASEHHIEFFTQSSLGYAFHHALFMQSTTLHFKSLSIATLLHEFSTYDVYDGSDDNMFFSEYSEFLHALLKKVNQDEPTLPSFFTSLFCCLCHQSSIRINRYELILCLGFLTNEFYQSDNQSAVWALLQIGSSIPNTITSFRIFAEAVATITTVLFPTLLPNLQKTSLTVINDIESSLLSIFCGSFSPKEVMISEECFYSRAPASFRLDQIIRLGNGLLNGQILSILEAFSFESVSYKTLLTVLNRIETPTVSVQCFTDLLNSFFPLPPFSNLKEKRETVLSSFFKVFADEDELRMLTVKAAFSSIFIENRYDLWNEVLTLFPAGQPLNQSDVMSVLEGMIAMSLFVYMDELPSQFSMACSTVLCSLSLPSSIEDLSTFFYNHSDLLLPSSYNPSLFSRPVIAYNTVMNLRYIAGLGDILFSHLHTIIQDNPGDEMKKGVFYSIVETIAGQKTIDISLMVDVYDRIFHLSDYLDSCFYGITKNSLILFLSGLYPNNRSLIAILYSILSTDSTISFNSFHNYLLHVYFLLNEFFECFDLTLVSISNVAMTVATECFSSFNLTSTDSLSKQQFEEWMHLKGPYEISRDHVSISHYPPIQTHSCKVTYNSLSSTFSNHDSDSKDTESTRDIQICLDKLASFASLMYYHTFTELIKDTISQQLDPQGDVARSTFISIVSICILLEYTDTKNEERELRLEESIHLPNEGNERQEIREGLIKLYDSLDINNGKLIPGKQLVSILCLLSDDEIDVRLKSMITESCTVVDESVHLHEVDLVISAFFLFMDHLLPEVFTSHETTPLVQASLFYNTLLSHCDRNLVEVSTVVHFFHQELIFLSALYRNSLIANTKMQDLQLMPFMKSFHLPLASVEKFKHPFMIDSISSQAECCYYIEELLRERKDPNGLIDQSLNRVLCRDFLRRMFAFWKNQFPPNLLEPLISLLFTLYGEDDSMQFNDLFIVMTSFIVLPQNSVTTVVMLFYDVLQTISNTVKFPLVERGVELLVRWWLWIVDKKTLLSSAQIHSLLIDMLFLTEEDCEDKCISLNELVGSCVTQSIQPSSLDMQRMMGCLFHSCRDSIREIWKGEMP